MVPPLRLRYTVRCGQEVAARLLLLRLRHERIVAEPGEKRLIRVGHAPRSPEAAGTVPMAMHTQTAMRETDGISLE